MHPQVATRKLAEGDGVTHTVRKIVVVAVHICGHVLVQGKGAPTRSGTKPVSHKGVHVGHKVW